MASVTSLDKDMRKLRLDRYTPQASKEARTFIEDALGEPLAKPDLIDSLKDGVALCKYATNLSTSPKTLSILTSTPFQACQFSGAKYPEIQDQGCDALCTDGEHLPVSGSLQKAALRTPIARCFPHR